MHSPRASAISPGYALAVMHGILWFLGVYPVPSGTSAMYQLWSGFMPALTVLTLLGSAASFYHLHNCHQRRCPRLGKHKVDGTPGAAVTTSRPVHSHHARALATITAAVILDASRRRLVRRGRPRGHRQRPLLPPW